MLPAAHRLTDASSFRETTRRGKRASSRLMVVHVRADEDATEGDPARVGLVVSRAVGNAVVRNRVKRRLRHLAAQRLVALSPGSSVVVRALPAAAGAGSDELARELDRCLDRSTGERRQSRGACG